MKNACLFVLVVSLLAACGRTEKAQDSSVSSTTATAITTDSSTRTTPAPPKPQNCQSVVEASQLGKANVYEESAKAIKVTLTLNQDTTSLSTADGCYFNDTVTVLATKRLGSRVFKRTLLKDDLLYFIKNDAVVEQAVLQKVIYKPTFNGQKYVNLTFRLVKPGPKKTTDFTLFMNYFGEIVKVK